ncbi:MAG TPA: serine hydrolase, partial [Candidatus Saccharimonadales bacterium]|nr:serine hydrolase [Candidatus Saccharimonadales bacterium]
LEKTDSQQLLAYLTKSTATNRLTKGLPASVAVAHKVGVNNANWAESDCGIVYVPKRPYIICVMVGLPEDQADKFIADVSKIVYDFVSQQ